MTNLDRSSPDEMDWKSVLPRFLVRGLNLLPTRDPVIWEKYYSAVWKRDKFGGWLESADRLPSNRLNQLLNVDRQKTALVRNVDNFLQGLPSNNVLLWGGRGTGKSSMILSLLAEFLERGLRLLEVKKDGLEDLSEILRSVSHEPYKFIIYLDDLSFDSGDGSYKVLKSHLEGSTVEQDQNIMFCATSNRRHLLPEYGSDNQATRIIENELHESEVVEEKISLSDRFGLWLSFHPFRQEAFLDIVTYWINELSRHDYGRVRSVSSFSKSDYEQEALAWARSRGNRSGRTAKQFAIDWLGRS